MALLYNIWGPAGTLSINAPDSLVFNGVQYSPPLKAEDLAAIGSRFEILTENGITFSRFRRELGDAEHNTHASRSQMSLDDAPHLADWVGEGEAGADADKAYRWYRWKFRPGPRFPTEHLSGSGAYVKLLSAHIRRDLSPPDTAGLQNCINVSVRRDPVNGRLRYCMLQNNDSDPTTTVNNDSKHQREICSWRFDPTEWQDVVVYARWSHSVLGELKVWRNRYLVCNLMGQANAMNNAPSRGGGGPPPAWGITGSHDVAQDCDHFGILVGGGAYSLANFKQMYPEDPNAVPLERVNGPRTIVGD